MTQNAFTRWISAIGIALIWQVSPVAGQSYSVLHSFSLPDGINPQGALILGADGNLYGTASSGGSGGSGTVFRVTPVGGLSVVHTFDNGEVPESGVIQASDGTFYGSTTGGGSPICGCGSVYRVTDSGSFAVVHIFSGPDGKYPSGLTIGADGRLYGGTFQGGDHDQGTIFRIDPSSGEFTTLHSFVGIEGSLDPTNALIQASDGNLYGISVGGGALQDGTIFRVDPAGNLTTLHTFNGTDGAQPIGQLIQTPDGALYGTTAQGGATTCEFGCGTVFKVDAAGNFATLHSFSGSDGSAPVGGLTLASDHNLYGTTSLGGAAGTGTIFKIDGSGAFSSIFSFGDPSQGAAPVSRPVQGPATGLFGTTPEGGNAGGGGVLFKFALPQPGPCIPDATTLCLNNGRFEVRSTWTDFQGNTGNGNVVSGVSSSDSGLFWFFGPSNWEVLIKVLNGCGVNSHYWVFGAAATDVGYTLQVTDTQTGEARTYTNPLGTTSPAITDTAAFASCP